MALISAICGHCGKGYRFEEGVNYDHPLHTCNGCCAEHVGNYASFGGVTITIQPVEETDGEAHDSTPGQPAEV